MAMSTTEFHTDQLSDNHTSPAPSNAGSTGTSGITVRNGPQVSEGKPVLSGTCLVFLLGNIGDTVFWCDKRIVAGECAGAKHEGQGFFPGFFASLVPEGKLYKLSIFVRLLIHFI